MAKIVITLQTSDPHDEESTRALRHILKRLLRNFRMRCSKIEIKE